MKVPAFQLALSAEDAAALLDISERSFHERRKEPAFPKARLVGGRLRWVRAELEAWLVAQPTVDTLPEPHQLARSTKRTRITFTPRPEAWPPPPGSGGRLAKAPRRRKTVAADDAAPQVKGRP